MRFCILQATKIFLTVLKFQRYKNHTKQQKLTKKNIDKILLMLASYELNRTQKILDSQVGSHLRLERGLVPVEKILYNQNHLVSFKKPLILPQRIFSRIFFIKLSKSGRRHDRCQFANQLVMTHESYAIKILKHSVQSRNLLKIAEKHYNFQGIALLKNMSVQNRPKIVEFRHNRVLTRETSL